MCLQLGTCAYVKTVAANTSRYMCSHDSTPDYTSIYIVIHLPHASPYMCLQLITCAYIKPISASISIHVFTWYYTRLHIYIPRLGPFHRVICGSANAAGFAGNAENTGAFAAVLTRKLMIDIIRMTLWGQISRIIDAVISVPIPLETDCEILRPRMWF